MIPSCFFVTPPAASSSSIVPGALRLSEEHFQQVAVADRDARAGARFERDREFAPGQTVVAEADLAAGEGLCPHFEIAEDPHVDSDPGRRARRNRERADLAERVEAGKGVQGGGHVHRHANPKVSMARHRGHTALRQTGECSQVVDPVWEHARLEQLLACGAEGRRIAGEGKGLEESPLGLGAGFESERELAARVRPLDRQRRLERERHERLTRLDLEGAAAGGILEHFHVRVEHAQDRGRAGGDFQRPDAVPYRHIGAPRHLEAAVTRVRQCQIAAELVHKVGACDQMCGGSLQVLREPRCRLRFCGKNCRGERVGQLDVGHAVTRFAAARRVMMRSPSRG